MDNNKEYVSRLGYSYPDITYK